MDKNFLEVGKIVNTHGIRGEVKVEPWADSPDFLCSLNRIYIDSEAVRIRSARVQKNHVILTLTGVADIDAAIGLKNKVIFLNRNDISLPEGAHFIQDLIGVSVFDGESGAELGRLAEVLTLPAGHVYVVRGAREILIPAVDEFILKTDLEAGRMDVRLIEGM
jgi:16S rRNA processing protein RimM